MIKNQAFMMNVKGTRNRFSGRGVKKKIMKFLEAVWHNRT